MSGTFAPDTDELINRARADLRMGVPVVLLAHDSAALVLAAETMGPARLGALRDLGGEPVLVVTGRRAETLKARAYDGDVARLPLPKDADSAWIRAIADPADDLRMPMKGPLFAQRSGDAALHRLAIHLVKSAQLLPAAVVLECVPAALPNSGLLTHLNAARAGPVLMSAHQLHPVVSARIPARLAAAGRLHVFRPDDGGAEHYAFEIGAPDRSARFYLVCIRRVLPAMFWGQ